MVHLIKKNAKGGYYDNSYNVSNCGKVRFYFSYVLSLIDHRRQINEEYH